MSLVKDATCVSESGPSNSRTSKTVVTMVRRSWRLADGSDFRTGREQVLSKQESNV